MTTAALFENLDESPLARSPLVTVIWQLRYEQHAEIATPHSALSLLESLGGESNFELTQLPSVQLAIQPLGKEVAPVPAFGNSAPGWRFAARDASCQISIDASSVSLEAAAYGSWVSDFQPRLQALLEAVEAVGPPVIESRLGLRYVNVIVGSAVGRAPFASAGELAGVIAPWLNGPLTHEALGPALQSAQARMVFKFEAGSAILNHGVVTADNGELGYLLDVDAYRDGARAFVVGDVLSRSAQLHAIALGLFQASLTGEAVAAMRSTAD